MDEIDWDRLDELFRSVPRFQHLNDSIILEERNTQMESESDKPIAPIQFNWKRRRRQLQDWLEATSITETLAQHEPYTMVKIHSYLKGRHYSVVAVSECSPKDEWDKGRGVEVANGHGYKKLARRLVAVERNLAKKGKITDYLYKAEDFTLGPVWN